MSSVPHGARRSVAAGTITLLSARLAVAALAMVFIAVSTRILTLREMAVFFVYNTLCGTQAMICSLGLLTTCTREIPALMGKGDVAGASRLLKTSLLTNASISAVVSILLAAAARPLSLVFLKEETFAPQMRWIALGVFLWNLFEANQLSLVALQRFRHYGRANILCAVSQRAVSLTLFALLVGSGRGLSGYIVGYALGTIVGILVTFAALRDILAVRSGLAPLPPLLRFAMPFYADGYFRYLYTQADQLLIGIFLAPEVLALYGVAKRFIQYYQQLVAASVDPVLAKVAEMRSRGRDAVERSLRSASRYFVFVFLPFSAGSAALSGLFLRIAGGGPYLPATGVLALLSLSVAAYAAFNLVTGYVYVLGIPSDRLKHNLVAGTSQITLMAALLWTAAALHAPPLLGAAAIALARVVSLLVGLLYANVQLRRYIAPVYDLQAIGITTVATAAMAAVIVLPQLAVTATAAVPILAVAGVSVFVMIIRSALRAEDLDLMGDLLRGRVPRLERFLRLVFLKSQTG